MTTATLSSNGEITIPASVRESLGVQEGDQVQFVKVAPGKYEVFAVTHSIRSLKGIFKSNRPPLSIEEMNEIIAECGAAANDSGRERNGVESND